MKQSEVTAIVHRELDKRLAIYTPANWTRLAVAQEIAFGSNGLWEASKRQIMIAVNSYDKIILIARDGEYLIPSRIEQESA